MHDIGSLVDLCWRPAGWAPKRRRPSSRSRANRRVSIATTIWVGRSVRRRETSATVRSFAAPVRRAMGLRVMDFEGRGEMVLRDRTVGLPDRAKVFQMDRRRADRLAAVAPGDRRTFK